MGGLASTPEFHLRVVGEAPARVAHIGGLVLADILDLVPERDGEPMPLVLEAIDAASKFEKVGLLARVRNSRPPPPASREILMQRLGALDQQLVSCCVALEDSGFRGAAFRSFLAAARALRIIKGPLTVHENLAAALPHVHGPMNNSDAVQAQVTAFFKGPPTEVLRAPPTPFPRDPSF